MVAFELPETAASVPHAEFHSEDDLFHAKASFKENWKTVEHFTVDSSGWPVHREQPLDVFNSSAPYRAPSPFGQCGTLCGTSCVARVSKKKCSSSCCQNVFPFECRSQVERTKQSSKLNEFLGQKLNLHLYLCAFEFVVSLFETLNRGLSN